VEIGQTDEVLKKLNPGILYRINPRLNTRKHEECVSDRIGLESLPTLIFIGSLEGSKVGAVTGTHAANNRTTKPENRTNRKSYLQ
jgi:hypothetical protein